MDGLDWGKRRDRTGNCGSFYPPHKSTAEHDPRPVVGRQQKTVSENSFDSGNLVSNRRGEVVGSGGFFERERVGLNPGGRCSSRTVVERAFEVVQQVTYKGSTALCCVHKHVNRSAGVAA